MALGDGYAALDLAALDQLVDKMRPWLPNAPLEARRQVVLELIPGTGPYRLRFGENGELDAQIVVPLSAPVSIPGCFMFHDA